MDAVTTPPTAVNEPGDTFAPGSPARAELRTAIQEVASASLELHHFIGGEHVAGDGTPFDVVQPHKTASVLGTGREATKAEATAAVQACRDAAHDWRAMDFDDRAAIFLRAADLLSGPYRQKINAATMLGQSKSPYQAEIDTCELADFWRYNVSNAREIYADQPHSDKAEWNRLDYRPIEGFVYAITPFNFTSISGNLAAAPALMGTTAVWKPSATQAIAAHWTMKILEAAGLPPGVINLVYGPGPDISDVLLADPDFAGIHFTGSTAVFKHLWRTTGENLDVYKSYPRLVGETGGKDFVLAHPSAEPKILTTALLRGAFDYQGQKCSAASRAFIPKSVWATIKDDFLGKVESIQYGDVADFRNFGGAVIDDRAFAKLSGAIDRAKTTDGLSIGAGGKYDDSVGYFIDPTVLIGEDPGDDAFHTEYFGPLLSVHVYDDSTASAFYDILTVVDHGSPYALTGSIIADDRAAVAKAQDRLRYTAGNFYINDKPSGAVVGHQPFGGARASGTDDKAGTKMNLLRWTAVRAIKETFVAATDHRYPHQEPDA
ncbi:MAG: L-glutamate gamma-semialdehyde dehydrogenase [Gordonia sp. (in: high G+C Gram-positive bacteria)]